VPDDIDWTRLARYFAGESSPEETGEIRRWIEADPERRRVIAELRAAWEAAATPDTAWDTPAAWRRLAARLHSRERRPRLAMVRGTWPDSGRTGWTLTARRTAIAAMAVLAVGAGLVWRGLMPGPDRTVATPAPLREVSAPPGQRARFQLTDGSRVLLAPGSVLRYDTTRFTESTRELQLQGRAHFVVIHDPRRPFLVRTARTVTEDLGTEFVITDYAGDPAPEIVVASGTVAVRSVTTDTARPATVLRTGELVWLDSAGRATVRRGVDLRAQLAWTEGRLVFVDTPVGDVVTQLNRWFGGDVRLGDPALAAHRFTAAYVSASEATVARELATAIGARVERRGNIVVLVPLSVRSQEN
jgi:ferric-dicitrate binding protein FerR (iron transport regulator)